MSRWRTAGRLSRQAIPAVVFVASVVIPLVVLFGPWPYGWPVSSHSEGLLLQAYILQLLGLAVAASELLGRGKLFGRSDPVRGIRGWLSEWRTLLSRPTPVPVEASGSIATEHLRAEGRGTTATEPLEILKAEVAFLRADHEKLVLEVRKNRREMRSRIDERHGELTKAIAAMEAKSEKSAVGGLAWAWVGVGWLVVGLLMQLVVSILPTWPFP